MEFRLNTIDWMAELQPIAAKLIGEMDRFDTKQDGSPVTKVDREIEQFLREKIQAMYPQDGVIGEEFPPYQTDAARQWVIDPIDGTRALISGWPTFTVLVALLESGVPIASSIYQPITGEHWVAEGKGTLYQDESVSVSGIEKRESANFSTTSPFLFKEADKSRIERIIHRVKSYQFGGDAYAYGKLACGKVDLIIESGMQPYDFLPLVPIVQGAGGVITDWQGAPLTLESNGDVIAAATESLHHEAMALLNAA